MDCPDFEALYKTIAGELLVNTPRIQKLKQQRNLTLGTCQNLPIKLNIKIIQMFPPTKFLETKKRGPIDMCIRYKIWRPYSGMDDAR